MRKRIMVVLSMLLGVGFATPAAFAATTLQTGHGAVAGALSSTGGGGGGGTLPFTGASLTLFVVAGIGALLIGLVLRRVSRRESR